MRRGNATIRGATDTLSNIWPKAAIYINDESKNKLLTSNADIPSDIAGMVIVEPLFEGWGTTEQKQYLFAPGLIVKYTTVSNGGGEIPHPVVEMFTTSLGMYTYKNYYQSNDLDFTLNTETVALESTNLNLSAIAGRSSYQDAPFFNPETRIFTSILLDEDTMLNTMVGKVYDMTTGTAENYLKDSLGNKMALVGYDPDCTMYLCHPGAYVNELYIIGVLKMKTTSQSFIYVWNRDGSYVGSHEADASLGDSYLEEYRVEVIDMAANKFLVSGFMNDSNVPECQPSYQVVINNGVLEILEISFLNFTTNSPEIKMFNNLGNCWGANTAGIRGEEGSCYISNGGYIRTNTTRGIYKYTYNIGVEWSVKEDDIVNPTSDPQVYGSLISYVHYMNAKVYATFVWVGNTSNGVGVVEIDALTGQILRRSPIVDISSNNDDMWVNTVLVNRAGTMVIASYSGYWVFNLNTMTLVNSAASTSQDISIYRLNYFVDNQDNFFFFADQGNIIRILNATGDNECIINLGYSLANFTNYYITTPPLKDTTIVSRAINGLLGAEKDAGLQFDGWACSPIVHPSGVYIMLYVRDYDAGTKSYKYYKLTTTGIAT